MDFSSITRRKVVGQLYRFLRGLGVTFASMIAKGHEQSIRDSIKALTIPRMERRVIRQLSEGFRAYERNGINERRLGRRHRLIASHR